MPPTVLLVDDDSLARRVLEMHFSREPRLKELGVRLVHAADGQKALAAAEKDRPDLVVVDLVMPRMDGFAFCRSFRARAEGTGTPLLIVSGVYRDPQLTSRLIEEVHGRFLPKPIAAREFADAVLSLLGGPGAAPEPLPPALDSGATFDIAGDTRARAAGATRVADAALTAALREAGRRSQSMPVASDATTPPMAALASGMAAAMAPVPARVAAPAAETTVPPALELGLAPRQAPVPAFDLGVAAKQRMPGPGDSGSFDAATTAGGRRASEFSVASAPTRFGPNDTGDRTSGSIHALPRTRADQAATAQLARQIASSQQGSLAEHPLPWLLFDLLETRATGTLSLRRGRMRKDIFVSNGKPIGAESNLRQEAFGAYLIEKGVLDEPKLQHLLAECKTRRKKMGALLVELGWMTESEVLKALEGQARRRIATSLRWQEGEWTFTEGNTFADRNATYDIDVERVVLAGLARTASLETLTQDLGAHTDRTIILNARAQQFREVLDSVFGIDPVSIMATSPTIGALMNLPNAERILPAIEALLATGMAALGEAEAGAFPPAPPSSPDPLSLQKLRETASSPALPDPTAFDESPPTAGRGRPPSAAGEAKRRDLLRAYLQIHDKSLYEVLGVAANTDVPGVRRAYEAFMARLSDEAFKGVDLGRDAQKLDEMRAIATRAFDVLSDAGQRRIYDIERKGEAPPRQEAVEAELAFREGLTLLGAGRYDEARARFHDAAVARPDQAAYHAYLGWTGFLAAGDDPSGVVAAQPALEQALLLDPDLVEGHDFLGRIAAQIGDGETARAHLEQALAVDPARVEAFDVLAQIHASGGDIGELEKLHRRIIHRLGDREPALRQRLWRALGDLYAQTLGDQASAQIAYEAGAEIEARTAADEPAPVREAPKVDMSDWRGQVRALALGWRSSDAAIASALALVDVLRASGHEEAAATAAAVLALRGVDTPEIAALAEGGRPRELPRIGRALDAEVFARLRHCDEDDDVEELIGLLAEGGVIEPTSIEDLGLSPDTIVAPEAMPEAFGEILAAVAGLLGLEPPPVQQRSDLGFEARLADCRPYVLLTGEALLGADDRLDLAFRLGRAFCSATPARAAALGQSAGLVRSCLAAAMVAAGAAAPEGDPAFDAVWRRLEVLPSESADRLRAIGARLAGDRKPVNVTGWVRGLGRTASRLGLLLCGDLVRAGQAVAAEEGVEALTDLLDFALSPEHTELRHYLSAE